MGAQTYDTGLELAQRTMIRNAIIERLGALLIDNDRYVASIVPVPRPYRGEGDEQGVQLITNALLGQSPAIGVALGRKTYEATDVGEPHLAIATLEVAIIVTSQQGRDVVDGRLATDVVGDAAITADPGLETLLEHIEELLLGQSIGVDGTQELRPVDEEEVATAENVTFWQQTYSLKVERQINPKRGITTLLTSIEGQHTPHDIVVTSPVNLKPLVTTVAELDPPEED